MPRFTSKTFVTASVGAGDFLNHNEVIGNSTFDILKIKIVPSVVGVDSIAQIYEKDTFTTADLVWGTNPFPATGFDPVQQDSAGVETEANRGFVVPYEDQDATGELHIKLVNNDTQAKTYTITIIYEIVPATSVVNINDLSDVVITAVASGELLKWDGANWINNTLSEAGVAAASHVHSAADITTGLLAIARGGTGVGTALAAFNALSPVTTLGDVIFRDASNNVRLAGNITTAKQFLTQTGTGAVSAAPTWAAIIAGDLPTHVHSAADVTSGVLAVARGGTALGSTPANGQLLIGDAVDYQLATLTGTAEEVAVANAAGSITLSLPTTIQISTALGVGASPATSAGIELSSTTKSMLMSRMTTTQRDALTPVDGMILYNITALEVQGRVNAAWVNLGVGSGGFVDVSGTPANNQLAVWTDADTLEGDANLTWDGSIFDAANMSWDGSIFTTKLAANGQAFNIKTATATISSMSGPSVTASNLIPAGAFVIGVTTRVTILITGPAGFDVGEGIDIDRWGNSILVALNTTSDMSDFTSSALTIFPAANDIVITSDGAVFTAGTIRITVHYIDLTPATS